MPGLAGVVDATQVREVLQQWAESGHAEWKEPLLRTTLARAHFSGKRSTPYAPGSVHDYMHAKVTVADDTVFVGSFNLSHSGELNAENVLELEDPQIADRLAAFGDEVRKIREAWDSGGSKAGTDAVSEKMLTQLGYVGDANGARERIAAHEAAGADLHAVEIDAQSPAEFEKIAQTLLA